MTVIAAFKVEQVPILLGDFLVTDEARGVHSFLATRPDLAKATPPAGGRRICGLRRKIYRLNDSVVVGYTGPVSLGARVIAALKERLADAPGAHLLGDIDRVLKEFKSAPEGEGEVVGWHCANRPLCFRWSSKKSGSLEVVSSAVTGSGARHLTEDVLKSPDYSIFSAACKTALDRATHFAISKVGNLLIHEIVDGSNLAHAYGFGGEVLIWDGARFNYVDKIAFAYWFVILEPDGSISASIGTRSALYRSCELYSVLQVSEVEPSTGFLGGLKATKIHLNVITGLDDVNRELPEGISRLDFDAVIWFTAIQVHHRAKGIGLRASEVSEFTEDHAPISYVKHGVAYLNVGLLRERLPPEFLT